AREDRLAHRMAVIMPKEVQVKSSPDKSGVRLFAIHEGLKVEIVDDFDGWYQVRLQDGKKGWVQRDVLERI
ncbi:MAG: SH3 domain-containing protein, partial [Chlorobi bacterium]|nr:SH3 domain-containing protein [Chlorobiota bacterium]